MVWKLNVLSVIKKVYAVLVKDCFSYSDSVMVLVTDMNRMIANVKLCSDLLFHFFYGLKVLSVY